jgi:hypothetical protein
MSKRGPHSAFLDKIACFTSVPGDAAHSSPPLLHSHGSNTVYSPAPLVRVYDSAVAPAPREPGPASYSHQRVLLVCASSPIPVHC